GEPERQALDLLRRWNQDESAGSPAAAIFLRWYGRLLPALVADELGPDLYARYARHEPLFLQAALADPEGRWCDDITTARRETCAEIAERTLHEALQELTRRLGPDMARWSLGAVQRASFRNPVGSAAPVLGRLFTRWVPMGGDNFTVRVAASAA